MLLHFLSSFEIPRLRANSRGKRKIRVLAFNLRHAAGLACVLHFRRMSFILFKRIHRTGKLCFEMI